MVRIVKRVEDGETYYDIFLTRGDTLYLTATPKDSSGNTYEVQEGDTIRFAMKRNYSDELPTIEKPIDTTTFTFKIDPEDTKTMPLDSTWVYDVEMTKVNGDVSTYIKGRFTPTKEVH